MAWYRVDCSSDRTPVSAVLNATVRAADAAAARYRTPTTSAYQRRPRQPAPDPAHHEWRPGPRSSPPKICIYRIATTHPDLRHSQQSRNFLASTTIISNFDDHLLFKHVQTLDRCFSYKRMISIFSNCPN
jgi:hypothetical protein